MPETGSKRKSEVSQNPKTLSHRIVPSEKHRIQRGSFDQIDSIAPLIPSAGRLSKTAMPTLQSNSVSPQTNQRSFQQSIIVFLRVSRDVVLLPFHRHTAGFEDRLHGIRELVTNAVAGKQGDCECAAVLGAFKGSLSSGRCGRRMRSRRR